MGAYCIKGDPLNYNWPIVEIVGMGEDWFVKYTEEFNRLWSNRACRTRLDRTRGC